MTAFYTTMDHALVEELRLLLERGNTHTSRVGQITEFTGHSITIGNPLHRFLRVFGRHNNPVAQVAETLWVLSGRADIGWLAHYLPRAPQFSDDGENWRAAYGPRLFQWTWFEKDRVGGVPIDGNVDQIANVIRLIEREPDTRRAVISLWDPTLDMCESKDIPCNNWIQFLPRAGVLHMHVVARSNDIMWGWSGINFFEWSVLHELVANTLHMEVGPVTYFVGSFHLYEQHWGRAQDIVQMNRSNISTHKGWADTAERAPICYSYESWMNQLGHLMSEEPNIRKCRSWAEVLDFQDVVADPWLRQAIYILGTDAVWRNAGFVPDVTSVPMTDGLAATRHYLERAEMRKKSGPARGMQLMSRPGVELGSEAREWIKLRDAIISLQSRKAAVYGESWKKHGEVASIFANISRKYDRIENILKGDGAQWLKATDETLEDTIIDLGIYCVLYLTWLTPSQSFDDALTFLNLPTDSSMCATRAAIESTIHSSYAELESWLVGELSLTINALHDPMGARIAKIVATQKIAMACFMWLVRQRIWLSDPENRFTTQA